MRNPFALLPVATASLLPNFAFASVQCGPQFIHSVPTLGEWGAIGLVAGVAYVAGRALGRRKRK